MNLLVDPLLRVETPAGMIRMNLPALFAALGRDEVESLPGLQRHQADAFHVFLCYLGGAVLARSSDDNPVREAEYWRTGLRSLGGDDGDLVWTLVVDDLSKPAFMQPPLPEEDAGRLKPHAATPDELDLLPTAKNHDLKQARAARSEIDEWIYALVSVQTMSGFFGRGNQGIARMNSGFGNRSIVEVVHQRRSGPRWVDAMIRLLPYRAEALQGPWGYNPNGIVLIWAHQWDGVTSLVLGQLDPFYIEICRRIRLRGNSGGTIVSADAAAADHPRLAAKELGGVVGDAWLPVDLAKKASGKKSTVTAMTVGPRGLDPELLRRLLFGEGFRTTPLQEVIADRGGDVWLNVSVLVRGQGTTDGFQERSIHIPAATRRRLFGGGGERDRLAFLGKNAIEYAGNMKSRVLKFALFKFLEGGPEQIEWERKATEAWWGRAAQRYEALWSDDYFPWLWSVPVNFDEEASLREWAIHLRDHAWTVLQEAMDAMPAHSGHRYRVRTQAERTFWGALYSQKNFPFLKEARHAVSTDQ
jgi:CRISPR system Cascade subunit CasA